MLYEVITLADRVQHLGAPHRGGGEVLVDAVDEVDVVLEQQLLLLEQRRIEHAHGRAAVARDEHPGLEPAPCIGAHLVQRQAHQRIDAAKVNLAAFLRERTRDVSYNFV